MPTNQLVSGAYGLEVIVNPGMRNVYFSDIAVLRGKKIKHIDVCNELTVSSSGLLISNLEGGLTLRSAAKNIIDNMPLTQLHTSLRRGNRMAFNQVFDLANSFITFPNNNLVEAKVIYFVFYFDEPRVRNIERNIPKSISSFELALKQTRNLFIEEKKLKGARFKNILLSFPSITALGQTGIPIATSKKSFVTLQKGNLQFFYKVPLYLFSQNTAYYPFNFENITFDFTNSYIDVVAPTADDLKSVFLNCIIEA